VRHQHLRGQDGRSQMAEAGEGLSLLDDVTIEYQE
jgi:hypothetical protein